MAAALVPTCCARTATATRTSSAHLLQLRRRSGSPRKRQLNILSSTTPTSAPSNDSTLPGRSATSRYDTLSRPRHRTRMSLHSPETDDMFPDIWFPRRFPTSTSNPSSAESNNNLAKQDPFWKAFHSTQPSNTAMSSSLNAPQSRFSRDRAQIRLHRGASSDASVASKRDGKVGDEHGEMALIFAGLGSYPHLPTSPTPASLHIWNRASTALLTPSPSMGYYPSAELLNEFGPATPSDGEVDSGPRGSEWLRGWMAGGRTLRDLMQRPDLTGAFVLTSSVAVLASAQEATNSPSLLPRNTRKILGHGFIGTLTCLVVTGKISLEDAVRLCRIYALLPPTPTSSPAQEPSQSTRGQHSDNFMTTLLTVSSDPSKIRRYSLSEPDPNTPSVLRSISTPRDPLQRVLQIIHEMQITEGWNENLMGELYRSRGGVREWAGEAMINSQRMVVVSGTKGAVIKIIDRLRAGGLATPVMDLFMPAPYHTPLMRHAVHQFRDHLRGCKFYPEGGAPPPGWLDPKVEPDVTILDAMTCQPLDLSDIPSALTAYLTRPLQWGQTTRGLWFGSIGSSSRATDIRTVGKGTRGLGMQIDKEIRAATQALAKPAQQQDDDKATVKVYGGTSKSSRSRVQMFGNEGTDAIARVREFGVKG